MISPSRSKNSGVNRHQDFYSATENTAQDSSFAADGGSAADDSSEDDGGDDDNYGNNRT